MAVLLSLCFLLPNHYLPWAGFHAETWASIALLIPCLWFGVFSKHKSNWYLSNVLIALALLVTSLQFAFGLVTLLGTFWVNAIYLLGLLVALQAGEIWEETAPGQCMDYIAIAFISAAVLSLPIQLTQWAEWSWNTPLMMRVSDSHRPFANMAQPNLLADLYLLAAIGVSWQKTRNRVSGPISFALVALFLAGAALTGSRAAWVNVLVLILFSMVFHPMAARPKMRWANVVLACVFFAVVLGAPKLQGFLVDQTSDTTFARFSTESAYSRLSVWKMMLQASTLHPLVGYGFGQIIQANFAFSDALGVERGLFNYSHNLFLDLILWFGYPLGLLFSAACMCWLYKLLRAPKTNSNWHTQAFVVVLSVHCLFEFPIYYAYFLFPMAMLLGTVQRQLFGRSVELGKQANLALIAVGLGMLAVIVHDYFQIEQSFFALRFESRGIANKALEVDTNVWALTNMQEHLRVSRRAETPLATAQELAHMEDVVRQTPGPYIMYKLALHYGLAGNAVKAAFWLQQLCDKTNELHCGDARQKWERAVEQISANHLIPWPFQK